MKAMAIGAGGPLLVLGDRSPMYAGCVTGDQISLIDALFFIQLFAAVTAAAGLRLFFPGHDRIGRRDGKNVVAAMAILAVRRPGVFLLVSMAMYILSKVELVLLAMALGTAQGKRCTGMGNLFEGLGTAMAIDASHAGMS